METLPVGTLRIVTRYRTKYWLIKLPSGQWELQHRVIAEQKYGRPIRKGEHVHHLDRDGLNNSPENIVLLSSTEHRKAHRHDLKQPAKPLDRWARRYDVCVECLTAERPHMARGLCDRCYGRLSYSRNPEAFLARGRRYYADNRERVLQYDRERNRQLRSH
jgi:hypothetical protein